MLCTVFSGMCTIGKHRYSLFYKINVLLKVVFKQNFNKSYQAFGSFAT